MVPCFCWPAVSACRPLRPREARRLHSSSSFTVDAGLATGDYGLGAPNIPPPSDSREGPQFRGFTTVRFRYDLSSCSPSCRSRPGVHPVHEDFYCRAFGGLVTRTAAGYHYGVQLDNLHRRDFHPLALPTSIAAQSPGGIHARCFRRARLSPVWHSSVSCSRSSNRTGASRASGSRRKVHGFAHGKLLVRVVSSTRPST